jgi:peptidoglycan-associated lipoprotein
MKVMNVVRSAKFAAMILATLAIAGCAKNPTTNTSGGAWNPNAAWANGSAPGSQQDFVVNVGDRVYFDTNSSDLSAQARETLDKQAQWLNHYSQYDFTIEGHTDERGTREYNLGLGSRRAEIVRNYLISQGVSAQRIRTISFGKERPVAACDNESCWSQNRRAVTVLGQTS